MTKKLFLLILVSTIIKLIVASLIELGNDEVYYWTYAIQPDWSHFDHPPMVGLLIRLFTLDLHWVSDLSLRLGSIVCAAISTVFIYRTARLLINEKAGWYAAIIYQCSVYTGFIAGLFILPDSPQMPFWTAALYLMALLIQDGEDKKIKWWLLLGLMIGLATLCKVHALYLWAGFGLFILITRIKWLLNWRLYLGVVITLVCLFPIVYWNVLNDFITYRYHSNRVTNTHIEWDMLGREIAGEFAYQNPVIFVLVLVSLIAFARKQMRFPEKVTGIWLLCMSLPMIGMFWTVSLFNPTLPHWSGPGYIPLFIIAAAYLDNRSARVFPILTKIAAGLVIFVLIAGTALIRLSPVNFGSHEKDNYGEYCPTLDLSGWKDFSDEFSALATNDKQSGKMNSHTFIIVNKWFPGGHLEFYTSRTTGIPLIGIGELDDLHKFAWLNSERPSFRLGDDAYCIVPSNLPMNVMETYGRYFTSIETPVEIDQKRGGGVVRYFYVYRLKDCKALPPVMRL